MMSFRGSPVVPYRNSTLGQVRPFPPDYGHLVPGQAGQSRRTIPAGRDDQKQQPLRRVGCGSEKGITHVFKSKMLAAAATLTMVGGAGVRRGRAAKPGNAVVWPPVLNLCSKKFSDVLTTSRACRRSAPPGREVGQPIIMFQSSNATGGGTSPSPTGHGQRTSRRGLASHRAGSPLRHDIAWDKQYASETVDKLGLHRYLRAAPINNVVSLKAVCVSAKTIGSRCSENSKRGDLTLPLPPADNGATT